MTSKVFGNRLGLKAVVSKSETDLEKLRKENASLKKTVGEFSKTKEKMSDLERKRLLEKILDLETQKEKYGQEIAIKNEEICNLKEMLNSKINGDAFVVQMEKKAREAENLRNQLPAVTARCMELESKVIAQQNSQELDAASNWNVLEGQLKDALEKNQQWLVYDQQREAYVKGLIRQIFEKEQQLASVNQTLKQQAKEPSSEVRQEEKQKYYDRLLLTAKKDLEGERKVRAQLSTEFSALRVEHEDKNKEVEDLTAALQSVRDSERQQRHDEKKRLQDKMQRLKIELELSREKLEEEMRRSSELSAQVQVLHKSSLKWQEEQKRVAALEQQIQRCTSDFENEKVDRQNVQQQLYKVLRELRKAREQITRQEPATHLRDCYIDPSTNFHTDFEDKLTLHKQIPSPKRTHLLDESFLECPKCKAMYPTSQHRELLSHIDYCTS
ncbi:centrosomal protein of 55 kDa [Ascaphus truei]|uniref:centrosomal protein of 55 kDa n=1 Tax=Ascaphus truei TaxID=8439 RepID=UPI003F5AAB17